MYLFFSEMNWIGKSISDSEQGRLYGSTLKEVLNVI